MNVWLKEYDEVLKIENNVCVPSCSPSFQYEIEDKKLWVKTCLPPYLYIDENKCVKKMST